MPALTDSLNNWADAVTKTLAGSTVRDSQDLELVVAQPTTTKARDSQDLELVTGQPTTVKIRDSQDLELVTVLPSTGQIRNSQDVILLVVSNFFFVLNSQTTDSLNFWADSVVLFLVGALTETFSDSLNNWQDAFAYNLTAGGAKQPRVCVIT